MIAAPAPERRMCGEQACAKPGHRRGFTEYLLPVLERADQRLRVGLAEEKQK